MIPAEICDLPRWMLWREEPDKNGRPTKVPYRVNGQKASSTSARTWAPLWAVRAALNGYDGIGIALGDLGDGRYLTGVDLDACLRDDGALAPWAAEIIEHWPSYGEVSPSGAGLKLFAFIHHPPVLERNKLTPPVFLPDHPKQPEIALFVDKRYFTVTGQQYGDEAHVRDLDLSWIAGRLNESDLDRLLRTGDHHGPDKSRSGADAALACLLARLGMPRDQARELLRTWTWGQPGKDDRALDRLLAFGDRAASTRGSVIKQRIVTMDELNARFALLAAPHNPRAIVLRAESRPISDRDFRLDLSGQVVITGYNQYGQPIFLDADKAWLRSCEKHTYRTVVFTGRAVPSDTMNLWTGYGCIPRAGTCTRINGHVDEVLANSDATVAEALLNLMAWQLQHVGEPSRIIVVLVSPQQAGKGSFVEEVLLPMWGAHGFMTLDLNTVTGSFNDVLRGKGCVVLDEALFGGDKKAASAIKGIVATRQLAFNQKFVPLVTLPCAVNLWVLSNADHPVYVEEGDKRYWTLRISDKHVCDRSYFGPLIDEARNGGREAFLAELLARDVSNFDPQRDIPRQNALHADIVRRGVNPGDPRAYLGECCEARLLLYVPQTGNFGGVQAPVGDSRPWTESGEEVKGSDLLNGHRAWVGKHRDPSARTVRADEFWRVLTDAGFEAMRGTKGERLRKLPDPETCLKKLAEMLN